MVHHAERREGGGGESRVTGPDTIAAVATPPGRGAVGVVRVSGMGLEALANAILGALPVPRQATLRNFMAADGTVIDRGIALFFPAPHSFTGEDVLEMQGHGGAVVMDRLLARACEAGARIAKPGEFTERAFLNDKIDLAQAEAVADLINSASRRAAQSAMRSLSGEFSNRVMEIDRAVLELRVYLEAAIDFAEEEIDFLADAEAGSRLRDVDEQVAVLLGQSRQGAVLRDGLDVVIAGAPNAGKSSLLNRLLAEDRAIVTDIPGTTRDPLSADIEIDGIPLRLTDTAGIRTGGDQVEMLGVERARKRIAEADLVLGLIDDAYAEQDGRPTLDVAPERLLVVHSKVDLSGRHAGIERDGSVSISALTGAGLDDLRKIVTERAGIGSGEGIYLARRRHVAALEEAHRHVAEAGQQIQSGFGDLAAEELRHAQEQLGAIVGATSTEDLLGEIFRGFCIGK